MADKDNDVDTRKYYKKKALSLFIGKGYEYEEDGIDRAGVVMQTTSTNTNAVNKSLMRDYFNRLINLRYSDVKITSTEIADIKISDLKKVKSNLYVCTCEYVQTFYGFRDNRVAYGDKTTKRIKCYVEYEDTEDGGEYIILLGDVEAINTERI